MSRHQHANPPMALKKVYPPRKGNANRRIIGKGEDAKREYFLHATKGYRSFRR
jgi:hypothetical protein